MSMLDEMELRAKFGYESDAHATVDITWLVARVRSLETALRNIEDQCLHANAFANPPAVLLETAREALKES